MTPARPSQAAVFPAELTAPGAPSAPWTPLAPLEEVPRGAMRRVTLGDLDLLVAHTPSGVVVVDDRCPHMAAPLSLGQLDECVVACPLHEGRFDLCTGDVVQMPTTGGLDANGAYHPVWTPGGKDPKGDVPGRKAEARSLTRVRRFRYYPVRILGGMIEGAVPID